MHIDPRVARYSIYYHPRARNAKSACVYRQLAGRQERERESEGRPLIRGRSAPDLCQPAASSSVRFVSTARPPPPRGSMTSSPFCLDASCRADTVGFWRMGWRGKYRWGRVSADCWKFCGLIFQVGMRVFDQQVA